MSKFLTDSTYFKQLEEKKLLRASLIKERKAHQLRRNSYSDENKIEVVKTFLALGGNLSLTAASCGLSRNTIKVWKASNWWDQLVTQLKKEERLELSAKTRKILDKSMDLLLDRVENGDFVYDQKKGELVRKPVKAIELHKITIDMIDRNELLSKSMETNVAPESHDDKLKKLAEQFAALAVKSLENHKPVVEVTDVIFAEETPHAQNEERKT